MRQNPKSDKVSPEVLELLKQANLIISKGQANFESLEHEELAKGRIFFLLKIKCECVGKVAGANFGDIVFFTR
ncbi:MAG: ARMT1-like domain-containing protein [Bacillota bacterium]